MWLRIVHSGDWCLHLVLRTCSTCQKWMNCMRWTLHKWPKFSLARITGGIRTSSRHSRCCALESLRSPRHFHSLWLTQHSIKVVIIIISHCICYCYSTYICMCLYLCAKLFRQVAAALPGMDQSSQTREDGILFVLFNDTFFASLDLLIVEANCFWLLQRLTRHVAITNR